ncbi:hypothetical protein [Actinosynnema sp. NPDC023587]|uniref:Gp37-like protein n=1 Tax=Actinosynnema sp. NPDC023587 TaxID=3154695 RepID=UPI0033EB2191
MPAAYPIDPGGARRRPIAYRTATLVPRHLAVGRWSLTAPLSAVPLEMLEGGWRLAFTGGPHPLGGYVDHHEVSIGRDRSGGRVPLVTLAGPDDMTVLAERLAYPDPTSVATDQDAQAYDVRTGQASTVVLGYIAYNAGHLAITDRITPSFDTDIADPAAGGAVTAKARFDPLLDLIAPLADRAGLAVTVTSTTSGQRTLGIAPIIDRTGTARFSLALGNLASLRYERRAPTATYVVAGGRGEEDARAFRAANNAAAASAWRRVEAFTDARAASAGDGGAELQAAADKRLAETGPVELVDLVPRDTDRLTYGVGYRLGDRVLGEVGFGTGLKVSAVVREVEITVDRSPGQPLVRVVPRAATVDIRGRLQDDRAFRSLANRIGQLERR